MEESIKDKHKHCTLKDADLRKVEKDGELLLSPGGGGGGDEGGGVQDPPKGQGLHCQVTANSMGWGDGTSRDDASPYKCSGTPSPQINRPL